MILQQLFDLLAYLVQTYRYPQSIIGTTHLQKCNQKWVFARIAIHLKRCAMLPSLAKSPYTKRLLCVNNGYSVCYGCHFRPLPQ
jgi:hypothetical protein